jgi:AcrR family transcriptional regulator
MSSISKRTGKLNRRSDILWAAEKLMRSRGLSGVTTRQISQEVGCSEGALYVHFKGRLDLLLAMLEESLPEMLGPLQALRESVGSGSAQQNLVQALSGIFRFHQGVVPRTAGLFAEPELLVAYRRSLARQGKGPHLSMAPLADYIAAEQELGRIDSGADAKLAAYLLMSSSFFRAFMENFSGKTMQPSWDQFARKLVAAVAPQSARNTTK